MGDLPPAVVTPLRATDRTNVSLTEATVNALRARRQVEASTEWADKICGTDKIPQDSREIAIRKFCDELADLLVAKQRAYGPKAITEAPGGPLNGLAVRLFDKHARFQNLVEDGAAGDGVTDEALSDTVMDLCGYSVITTLVLRGAW